MIQPHFQWNGDSVIKAIDEAGWDGLRRAALFFHSALMQVVGKPYPPASKPGEPPRLRTGQGAAAIQYELDKEAMTARVGVAPSGWYMALLEVGGKRVLPRPFMRATLLRLLPQLRALAESGKP